MSFKEGLPILWSVSFSLRSSKTSIIYIYFHLLLRCVCVCVHVPVCVEAVQSDWWVRVRSYMLLHGIYMKLLVFPTFLSGLTGLGDQLIRGLCSALRL